MLNLRTLIGLFGLGLLLLARPTAAQTLTPLPSPLPEGEGSERAVDPRFGAIESFWKADDAADLNVGWDRILFYWNEIQPTGPDDWNTLHVLEEWLVEAREQDRMVMGLLKNTPAWATDGAPFSGVPRGLYLPVDDPDNLWAGYVRKVVEYYAPLDVHHWIIWNEPEIEPGVYGHEFAGSTRDYYQLLKVAYQVAKANDPQAVIHLAGWSYWHDPGWLAEFLQVATADPEGKTNNYFFDVITLHIYFRVETVEQLVEETWEIQQRFGLQKPIWINETNASPNLDPLWPVERPNFQVDLEQQASYIVQAHALAFGARSARIGVYKLLDVSLPEGGESFGILRPDGSRRPAFDAYRTTIRYLEGFTYPVGRQQELGFYAFTFKRPEGVTRILWARTAADVTVRLPALADEAVLVSATGEEQPLRALGGYYQLRLRGARCTPACDIGGPPVFVVEAATPPQRAGALPTIDVETAKVATATATADGRPPTAATATVDGATPATMLTETPVATESQTATPTAAPTETLPPTATAVPATVAPQPAATVAAQPVAGEDAGDSAATLAEIAPLPTVAVEATAGATEATGGTIASWLFLGAAAVLAAMLVFFVIRRTA